MAIALAAAFFADCMPAEASPAAHMACCEAMNHECGPDGEPQECCSAESPRIGAVTTAKQASLQPPVAAVSVAIRVDLRLVLEGSPDARHHLVPVKPPGVPRYILSATFRI